MMQTIKIHKYETERSKPDKTISIPISRLDIAKELMPTDIRDILKKEGIKIGKLADLSTKNVGKGTLIEVQSGKEKIVIEVE